MNKRFFSPQKVLYRYYRKEIASGTERFLEFKAVKTGPSPETYRFLTPVWASCLVCLCAVILFLLPTVPLPLLRTEHAEEWLRTDFFHEVVSALAAYVQGL
jgi:hypothetical protein